MNAPNLQRTLRRAGERQRRIDVLAAIAAVLALAAAAFLSAVVLDALLALSTTMLIAVNVVLVVLAVAAIVFILRTWAAGRFDPRRIARVMEERLGIRDSALINAVEFSAPAPGSPGTGGSSSLMMMAVGEGEQRAARADVSRAVDRLQLKRRGWMLLAAGGVIALTWVVAPRLFAMTVPRYVNPGADLPPFTLLDFEVSLEPRRVHHNKAVTITADITGPMAVDSAWVVFRDVRGRIAMLRTAEGWFILPIERAQVSRSFYVGTDSGRSAWHELNVLPTPLFEKVMVRYEYPAYTGWESREQSLRDGQIRAIAGTRITLTVESNLPLREAKLVITPGESAAGESADATQVTLHPVTNAPHLVRGSFAVALPGGAYRLTLMGGDGTPSETDLTGRIIAAADGPPQVQLLEPDLRIVAPEGFKVPVTVAASDDVAVERVTLQQRINEKPPVSAELRDIRSVARGGPRSGPYVGELDLAALNTKPGDVVRAFATAYDNHPDAPQSMDSATVEIRVVTTEEYNELARQQYGARQMARELEQFNEQAAELRRQRQAMIAQLQEMQEKLRSGDPVARDDVQKHMEDYARRSQNLAEQMKRRAEQPPLYDFEPPVQQAVAEQSQQQASNAAGAEESAKQLAEMSPEAVSQALAELERQQEADAAAQEQQQLTAEQMRKLAAAEKLMSEAERIKDIAGRQRELEQHLSTYLTPSTEPPAAEQRQRLARLADQQEQLREQLDDSLSRLETAAKQAESELPRMSSSAADLVQRMKQMAITTDQHDAAEQAERGLGAPAHAKADTAANKLESLIGQCNGLGECAGDDLDGLFGLSRSSLANALSQMARGLRAGSGSGIGMSGMTGTGSGSSSQPGAIRSNAPTLVGPHSGAIAGQMQVDVRAGSYGRADHDGSMVSGGGPERLNPDSDDPRDAGGAGGSQGVPAPYRGLAEQYFRRLATDSRSP